MAWRLLTECYDRDFDGMTDSEWRVFCVICRHANDDTGDDCFPSTALLAQKSRLSEKIVKKAVQSLELKKWIRTEQKPGGKRFFFVDTKKISESPFIVKEEIHPGEECYPREDLHPRAEVHPGEKVHGDPVQKFTPGGCTSSPLKEQLKEQSSNASAATDKPEFFLQSEENSPGKPKAKKKKDVADKPDDVSQEVWDDFLAHRKKFKVTVSDTVVLGFRREADKAGISLEDALVVSITNGWRGFNAEWLNKSRRTSLAGTPYAPNTQHLPPHKDPAFKFDDDYYSKVNPDNPWEGI